MEARITRHPSVFLLICTWIFLYNLQNAEATASPENTPATPIQVQLVTSLAKSGRPEAQYKLGVMYLSGYSVEKNIENSLHWLHLAAEQEHGKAQNQLGLLYLNGKGVARDCHIARQWFARVAHDSSAYQQAQSNLAWLLATCPDASARDGQQALKIARQLISTEHSDNPSLLDTLAAAFAETGQFQQAIDTQQQAIAMLQKQSSAEQQRERFTSRLQRYQLNQPWRMADSLPVSE